MDLSITGLLSLDQDQVDQAEQQLIEALQEAFPEADLRGGVLDDVVLHLGAVIQAAFRQRVVDPLRRSSSLLAIAQDPTLADDDTVDRVLSNFLIARQPGEAAAGQITVIFDSPAPATIPAGAVYTAGAARFASTAAWAGRVDAATVSSDTDRVLRPMGDGTYAMTVPVTALEAGSSGTLRRGTRLVPEVRPPHFVAAYAEGDFSGGYDPESNADLLRRLQEGIAAKAWSNRVTIDAMIRAQAPFARVLQTSVVGAGDPEMIRDRHTIFPVSLFGRCDLYARTAALPLSVTLEVECTLVSRTAQAAPCPVASTWQFSLGRDVVPGFYLVDRVAPPGASPSDSGYAIVDDVRGIDTSGGAWAPDIEDWTEAAYSPYQATTIRFVDTDTPTEDLVEGTSRAIYAVSVLAMPQLAELQAFIGGRDVRGPGGDVLVKAPIPCFLSVGFDVRKRATVTVPDVGIIAAAVASWVNTRGFAGQLHASGVAAVATAFLPDGAALSAIDLFGRIRRPDGTWSHVRSDEVLVVPHEPWAMVGPRTVAFILDPVDVAISVVDVEMDDA
jgi:hypothetical protein